MSSLAHFPALVLNADFRPLSFSPLSVIGWQDAIKGVYEETHRVIAEYDRVVRSPTIEMKLPSRTLTFTGQAFLLHFSLPNFFFHVTTAYAILRHAGVEVGKLEYLGSI